MVQILQRVVRIPSPLPSTGTKTDAMDLRPGISLYFGRNSVASASHHRQSTTPLSDVSNARTIAIRFSQSLPVTFRPLTTNQPNHSWIGQDYNNHEPEFVCDHLFNPPLGRLSSLHFGYCMAHN